MGLYDSFEDPDSTCPNCHKPVVEWQTKELDPILERWRKGDFFQYRKIIRNPQWKPENRAFGILKRLDKPAHNKPIIENGKISVHTYCESCGAWLEAHAKIENGCFKRIIEPTVTHFVTRDNKSKRRSARAGLKEDTPRRKQPNQEKKLAEPLRRSKQACKLRETSSKKEDVGSLVESLLQMKKKGRKPVVLRLANHP